VSPTTSNFPYDRPEVSNFETQIILDWRKLHNEELQVEEDEMGRACSTKRRRRGMHIGYWWESQKVRNHWEDQDIGGWTILKWILDRMGCYGLDRSGLG
jgi:hypothetical protein